MTNMLMMAEKKELEEVKEEEPEEEIKWFECTSCGMKEQYHFKERKPKQMPGIVFAEGSYIMKDPFTPPNKKQFLILGSDCSGCNKSVCQANDCSMFYKKRFCLQCAWENKKNFPESLQAKIKDPAKG